MSRVKIQATALHRIDEIVVYTKTTWGDAQAEQYVHSLFECFERIAERRLPWRKIPGEFGIDGYFCRFEKHFIYWRLLDDGHIGIVTILHERMHRLTLFRENEP